MGRISMPQGKGSQMHNRRDYEKYGKTIPENIDTSRSSQNVTFVDRDIREAYKEIFGKVLKEYNDKQKRADRRIDDYYDHISKSKNKEKLFYEDVVQWGSREDFINSPETTQKALDALVEYVTGFEQRNPNLKLIGAYIHMDEASPHLHIDYVPVATGYKQGLSMRNSLDRAMREMGFNPDKSSKKNNATKLWKKNERKVFGEICRAHGLEVEAERKARGSLSVEEYKEARDKMVGEIETEVQPLLNLKVEIDDISNAGKTVAPGIVAVKKKEFAILQEQAKAYTANRDEVATLRERKQALDEREEDMEIVFAKRQQNLDKIETRLDRYKNTLEDREHQLHLREHRNNNALSLLEEAEARAKEQERKNKLLQAKHQQELTHKEAQLTSLKQQIKATSIEVDSLKTEVSSLYQKSDLMAKGIATLLRAACYARDFFASRYSWIADILQATIDKGIEWLKEDGFEDYANGIAANLSKSICEKMNTDLYFFKGIEGYGVYRSVFAPEAKCLMNFDSFQEAKEMFPNCRVYDRTSDQTIRERLRIYQRKQERENNPNHKHKKENWGE